MRKALIVTNGDSAVEAIRAAGIDAEIMAWNDVLHEGPVPRTSTLSELSAVRVDHLVESGWGDSAEERQRVRSNFAKRDAAIAAAVEHPEVVLWFEHDLYDQLQLLQILAWFSADASRIPLKLQMICRDAYVGEQEAATLRSHFEDRLPVLPAALRTGADAWKRFTSEDPTHLEAAIARNDEALPFVAPALQRLAEEYPSSTNGLSRNERQILEVVGKNEIEVGALFLACQERERDRYLGDWSFWKIVEGLVNAPHAAVELTDGRPFGKPQTQGRELIRRRIKSTPVGAQIIRNQQDYVRLNGINKWLGGVHLTPDHLYRYDTSARRFTRDVH